MTSPPIILVAAFCLGAGAWDEVAALLRAEGHRVTAWLAGVRELRNATWIDLPTSHWPIWSRPGELAVIIGEATTAHARGG